MYFKKRTIFLPDKYILRLHTKGRVVIALFTIKNNWIVRAVSSRNSYILSGSTRNDVFLIVYIVHLRTYEPATHSELA